MALLMIRYIFKHKETLNSTLCIGLISGVSIYMGQVLFNFGVVATLVIFYVMIGMGLCITQQTQLQEKDQEEDQDKEKD
jgi:4-hydroxybenzoate polyprenyltransferase